jgi:FkbM family methyltransferase
MFHAQFDEDHALLSHFIGTRSGTCVEVGALDGIQDSLTYVFEQNGWQTILVEPMPHAAAAIRKNRKGMLFECAAGPAEGEVRLTIAHGAEYLTSVSPTEDHIARMVKDGARIENIAVRQRTLDSILEEARVTSLDFISIDVEGFESEVLKGFDISRWKPRLVILEDNTNGLDKVVPLLMQKHGYHCFKHVGFNDWYAHASDVAHVTPEAVKLQAVRKRKIRFYCLTLRLLPPGLHRNLRNLKRRLLKQPL